MSNFNPKFYPLVESDDNELTPIFPSPTSKNIKDKVKHYLFEVSKAQFLLHSKAMYEIKDKDIKCPYCGEPMSPTTITGDNEVTVYTCIRCRKENN